MAAPRSLSEMFGDILEVEVDMFCSSSDNLAGSTAFIDDLYKLAGKVERCIDKATIGRLAMLRTVAAK
jgi:hypothetical protein